MIMKILTFILLIFFNSFVIADPLKNAIESEIRSDKNVARDVYRHPYETLTFFGIRPDMTVIELSPGGGWYTEILAHYLKDNGELIAVHFDPSMGDFAKRVRDNFEKKLASSSVYDQVKLASLNSKYSEVESVDVVVTFRNLHNWIGPNWDFIIKNSYASLKKGGLLGVVEHRAKEGTSIENMKKTGYVTEKYAIESIEKLGFKLIAKSEINSNPKDTKDHPRGVWTLPPVMRLKELDQDKYLQIGESDRFTFLFKKFEDYYDKSRQDSFSYRRFRIYCDTLHIKTCCSRL